MITAIWVTNLSREYVLVHIFYPGNFDFNPALAVYFLHFFVSLFVICIFCAAISIKVRCSRHLCHGVASLRERKLTTTSHCACAFIELVALSCFLHYYKSSSWVLENSLYCFEMTVTTLYLAKSLVNPIIYSLLMPECKACVIRMFRKALNHDNTAAILSPLMKCINLACTESYFPVFGNHCCKCCKKLNVLKADVITNLSDIY